MPKVATWECPTCKKSFPRDYVEAGFLKRHADWCPNGPLLGPPTLAQMPRVRIDDKLALILVGPGARKVAKESSGEMLRFAQSQQGTNYDGGVYPWYGEDGGQWTAVLCVEENRVASMLSMLRANHWFEVRWDETPETKPEDRVVHDNRLWTIHYIWTHPKWRDTGLTYRMLDALAQHLGMKSTEFGHQPDFTEDARKMIRRLSPEVVRMAWFR